MGKRDARYEFIRVMSMLFVIAVHAFNNISANYLTETVPGQLIANIIFLCNGLFFMLSGKFALSTSCWTWKDYKRYYLKRFGSIGIPALVCMLLRSMYNIGWWPDYFLSSAFLKEYLRNVLGVFAECEYWFLYELVGFLMVAPFLGKMLQRMSRVELVLLTGIGIVFNGLMTYLPAMGISFGWGFPFDGWFVLFMLGYTLERIIVTEKEENVLLAVGAVGFVLTFVLKRLGLTAGIHGLAPTYAITTAAIFIALKRLYRPGRVRDVLITKIGGLTMAVYLLHMMVLYTVLPYIPRWPVLLRLTAAVLATTVLSLTAGVILDRTVFSALQWIYRKLVGLEPVSGKKINAPG